jgi:hypothetical protein
VLARAVMVAGLVVALLVMVGMPPAAGMVTAQDLDQPQPLPPSESGSPPPAQKPTSKPEAPPSDEDHVPPNDAAPRGGPAPAFAPGGGSVDSGAGGPGPASKPSVPPPPPLGAVTYENPLRDERVFKDGRCFGGRAFTQYVGEGFKLRVMGTCFLLSEDEAWITVPANGVTVGDGDVALDFKVVDGLPRARVGLYVRNADGRQIGARVHPGKGEASIFSSVESQPTELASSYNLGSVLQPGDWNRMAMRVSGPDVWLLLNDEPVLYASGVHTAAGGVIVELVRDGTAGEDDKEESAIVVRNLELTALEGGEPSRAPTGP